MTRRLVEIARALSAEVGEHEFDALALALGHFPFGPACQPEDLAGAVGVIGMTLSA